MRDGYDKVSEPWPLPEHLALEAAGVYQETYAALTRRAFEPAGYPAAERVTARCSPTTAEPTIFCFTVRRAAGAEHATGDGLPGRNGFRADGARVGVIMGSDSDWETMSQAADILEQFGVPFEAKVVSAHHARLDGRYAETAEQRGIEIIIAGAGGAAHLPAWWPVTRSSR